MQHVLNVFDGYSRGVSDVLDWQIAAFIGEEEVENAISPVADISAMAEIGQWFLWTALSFLDER